MRAFLAPFCLLALWGCSTSKPVSEPRPAPSAESPQPAPLKQYELRGDVISLDQKEHIAKIKHEQLGDWMGPMTMDFPVKDPADFAKLAAGKPVLATVNVQDFSFWVSDVQPAPAATKK